MLGARSHLAAAEHFEEGSLKDVEKVRSDRSRPAVSVPEVWCFASLFRVEQRNQSLLHPLRIDREEVVESRREHDAPEVSARVPGDRIEVPPKRSR